MSRDPKDLLHGTLDALVLKTLSDGPVHGYGIARAIETQTRDVLPIEDAALYKALRRLEADGAIRTDWGLSENNRRARFYSLTKRGRRVLLSETDTWHRFAQAVGAVLGKP
jgi:PadR family transcriptional regulator PadR